METKNNDGSQPAKPGAEVPMPFGDAFTQVIENLKNQPLLLFVLGAAILLLAIGTMALEKIRVLILPLLVLLVLGLAAWVFLEALAKARQRKPAGQAAGSGRIDLGKNTKVTQGSTIGSGDVLGPEGASSVSSGSITVGEGTVIEGSAVTSGKVRAGGNGKPKTKH